MPLEILPRLKPLYAHLKRVEIGKYLATKEFQLFVLEHGWDNTWAICKKEVLSKKRMFGLPHNHEEEEEAFAYFMSLAYQQGQQRKATEPNFFPIIIISTLIKFLRWNPIQVEVKGIAGALSRLEFPEQLIVRFVTDSQKIQQTKPVSIRTTQPNQIGKKIERDLQKVFIVHGHNRTLLLEVSALITKLGLTPIILHEQANIGQTIIEKFEKNSSVGLAIVLLTGDDVGKSKAAKTQKARARQNVILELGYFIGKLGRKRVIPLYELGVELPSDINGVVYEPIDKYGHWKLRVIREMKELGYKVDANQII